MRFLILHLVAVDPIGLLQEAILADEEVVLVDIHLNAGCSAIEALQCPSAMLSLLISTNPKEFGKFTHRHHLDVALAITFVKQSQTLLLELLSEL